MTHVRFFSSIFVHVLFIIVVHVRFRLKSLFLRYFWLLILASCFCSKCFLFVCCFFGFSIYSIARLPCWCFSAVQFDSNTDTWMKYWFTVHWSESIQLNIEYMNRYRETNFDEFTKATKTLAKILHSNRMLWTHYTIVFLWELYIFTQLTITINANRNQSAKNQMI